MKILKISLVITKVMIFGNNVLVSPSLWLPNSHKGRRRGGVAQMSFGLYGWLVGRGGGL